MLSENIVCSLCRNRASEYYCVCGGATTFLCGEDILKHYENNQSVPTHPIAHISTFFQSSQTYRNQRTQQRTVNLERAKAQLSANIERIDLCEQELSAFFTRLTEYIGECWRYHVETLRTEKSKLIAQVQEAVAEVSAQIWCESMDLQLPLAQAIAAGCHESLDIVTYKIDEAQVPAALLSCVSLKVSLPLEASAPIADYSPVFVTQDSILQYNVLTHTWTKTYALSQEINVTAKSVFVLLGQDKVLVSGGEGTDSRKQRYFMSSMYSIKGRNVKAMPFMSEERGSHGAVYDPTRNAVFFFGGESTRGTLRSAEKLLLLQEQVEQLADMRHARACFNPCVHNRLIYVCGGTRLRSVESFNPETNTFTLLAAMNLPVDSSEGCLAISVHGFLVVCTLTCIQMWTLETGEKVETKRSKEAVKGWSLCSPVVRMGVVYVISCGKLIICESFSLQDGSRKELKSESCEIW